ncbi:MAG: efflux RND transporter periplasmic adaptor subunit [Deltaproteobacteria bacterium]|nr:efflux RND transporter periplasmic adaptor subunit [Deltaproteobacteria bacterium]TLN01577.1 MAG: efflux RND transporter periplasmic adaptor subunit [bacterium]
MKISKRTGIMLGLAVILAIVAGGAYLWFERHAGHEHADQAEKAATQYTCPMHPFIIKDKPGACPICGMSLVPVQKGDGEKGAKADDGMLSEITLSPTQQLMANVETEEARNEPLAKEITAVGIVAYDQARQAKVTAWIAGRIDRLYVTRVGDWVSRSKPVAELYSPDLVSAQQEYLLALKSRATLKDSPIASISQGGEGLVASARQKLKLMGVKDHQIASLERSGEPNIRLPIYTPLSGVVIEKLVLAGQYVNVGDPLFAIADLSTVWVDVEVYENEFPFVKIGQKVEFSSLSYPGTIFTGKVSFIYPFLDPNTRTIKVRVELPNPGGKLKPEMYMRGVIKVPQGMGLSVPVTAVLDTGKRKVVWVEKEPGSYVPRDVTTADQSGGRIRILSGLKAGEKVAVSGGYLIDSEAQLKSGAGGGHEGHAGTAEGTPEGKPAPAPATGHEGHGTTAPAKKTPSLDMDDMNM